MAERIGRFRFRIETNHDQTAWYVWYKEGFFGQRNYVVFENNNRFDTRDYESNWNIRSAEKAHEALRWAKQKARDTLAYCELCRKSKIRKIVHKEP